MSDFLERISRLSPKKLALLIRDLQDRLDSIEKDRKEPIAIVGMGCRFPGGANSPEDYWRLLRDGIDAISEVPPDRWDVNSIYDPEPGKPGKTCSRYGGFLRGVDQFDALFFGISPREAARMDPQQRLLLEVAWETLENAGQSPEQLADTKTGVFVGICSNDYARVALGCDPAELDMYLATGGSHSVASGRLSYVFGLHGPSMSIDTACSSSLTAVHTACASLRARECSAALAGGVSIMLSPEATIMFSRSGMMARDGRCKTFDAAGDGYVRGEGCGMVLLKRLSEAVAAGDRVLATIEGAALNQDGRSGGITAPNGVAQQAVIREALTAAGLEPADIDFVETHGSGTALGDPIEVGALGAIFGKSRPKSDPLHIASVKTNIGHAEGAAGIAGLIKLVLALQAKQVPPHLHIKQLSSYIPWDELSLDVPTTLIPWKARSQRRIGGVSSFGFSGTNAHIIVAEAPQPKASVEPLRPHHLLTISAKSPVALHELVSRYISHLSEHPELTIAEVCRTASTGRSHFEYRLAAIAASSAQMRQTLEACAKRQDAIGLIRGHADLSHKPEVVFLFAGQGGQYLRMAQTLYDIEPVFRKVIDRCEALLAAHLEIPLRRVLYPKDDDSSPLDATQYTHVAIFAVQYALAQLWQSWGVQPAAVMGHSVGEIAAAAIAGGMSLEDGLMLVRERGRLMQSLSANGLMASLLAGEAEVSPIVENYKHRVGIAALNGPVSTVISGERTAVQEILAYLEANGIKTKPLNVSNSFHSPLVEPVMGQFEEAARRASYRVPQIPQFSSMRLDWVSDHNLLDASYWSYNLRNTVRFFESMVALNEQGYRYFLEIGPSPTLVGMASQCVPQGQSTWLPSLRRDRSDYEQMLESLATLYVNGTSVDWSAVNGTHSRPIALPTYPFQREQFAIDSLMPASATTRSVADLDLPSGHEALTALAKTGATLRAEWVTLPAEHGSSGTVRLLDQQNTVVAEISGFLSGGEIAIQEELPSAVDCYYQVEWQPKELPFANPKPSFLHARNWLIFADHSGAGSSLASSLRERGDHCVLIFADGPDLNLDVKLNKSAFVLDPSQPELFRAKLKEITQRYGTRWDGIVHLWSLDSPTNEHLSSDSLRAVQLRTCGSLLRLIQSLREIILPESARLWLVTRGVQAAGLRPEPVQVAQAPVRGLGRVIAMEHPELHCVNIDLDPHEGESNIADLSQEISCRAKEDDEEDQVAFRKDVRYVARLRHTGIENPSVASSPSLPLSLKPEATYAITGGLGDLGMKVAQWMTSRGARHLVLMGRRPEFDQARQRLNEMRQAGVDVLVFSGDVTLKDDVSRLFATIRHSMPPLRGVIHAAGIWKGGVLLQQDWNSFLEVLAPKVEGAWNLHQLTRSMSLDFFVLFSSGASVLGAAGLGDYAAANSFLDALAHLRQAEGLPGSSMNWGPWAELGMVRSVTSLDTGRWKEHGMSFIPLELALYSLEGVIRRGTTQISVLPIDWVQLKSGIPSLANSPFVRDLVTSAGKSQKVVHATPAKEKETLIAELARINDPQKRKQLLLDKLHAEAARILRLQVSQLDVNRSLNQFGMDSLMALELKNRVQVESGIAIPLATVLSGPPIADLAAFVMTKLSEQAAHLDSAPASETVSSSTDRVIDKQEAEELLKRLPELSDADVDLILSRMGQSGNNSERESKE